MTETIPTILQNIVAEKHKEVAEKSKAFSIEFLENMIAENNISSRGFFNSLQSKIKSGKSAVIAEIKKASPSKGVICENFNPEFIAKSYEENGAACLSVLTDEKFFQGSEAYLDEARNATNIPVIRKDFIVDEYQVYESKSMGADCILLIAACLNRQQISEFTQLAYELEMDVLVEIHNLEELEKIAGLPLQMIGINNRNLHNFEVNLQTTFDLSKLIPPEILVITESGIMTKQDVVAMNEFGIHSFLIGESFMRHDNPGIKLSELFYEK